ncbi:hypothetical protein CYMTET_51019 [Cymbomonas tetramitiformis]|uniref:Uncharacterized protein n=1 Tax=Cymbomonas tetramitiformis TaxID=36881 RepID=A0AAE0BN49_9CHLO|nr:hypothetical protein CYMTET_51019 [Cymbomonas tetramitiformis]
MLVKKLPQFVQRQKKLLKKLPQFVQRQKEHLAADYRFKDMTVGSYAVTVASGEANDKCWFNVMLPDGGKHLWWGRRATSLMPEVDSLPGTLGEAVALLASADNKLEKGASLGHRKLLTVCSMLRGVISFYQSVAAVVSSPVPGVDISIGPDCLETPPVILQISIASEGVGVGGAILSTHYQPTSVLSADCETQVSLVDLWSDVFTQTEPIPQDLPRTPLARRRTSYNHNGIGIMSFAWYEILTALSAPPNLLFINFRKIRTEICNAPCKALRNDSYCRPVVTHHFQDDYSAGAKDYR